MALPPPVGLFVVIAAGASLASGPVRLPDPGERAEILGKLHLAPHAADAVLPRGVAADRGFDVAHYDLSIEVTEDAIAGTVVVTAQAVGGPLTDVVLDLHDDLDHGAVTSSHGVTDVVRADDFITISLDTPVADDETFTVTVPYAGVPPAIGGPVVQSPFTFDEHGSADDGTLAPVIFTLSVPWRSGAWWPCKEALADRATIDVHVTVADTLIAASNGDLVGEVDLGDGRKTFSWSHGHPITPYLVMLAISDYARLTDSAVISRPEGGSVTVPLEYYVYPEKADDALIDFARFPDAMQHLSDLYGLYPFPDEKYGMALIEWSGGMEHQTCVSLGDRFVRGDGFYEWVFVHELSHHWWGDHIPLADWRDVWLNEGFATWSEALWAEHVAERACLDACPPGEDCADACSDTGLEAYAAYMNALDPFAPPGGSGFFGTIYDPSPLYGSTPYDKGAWVLHMLRGMLGDDVLFGDSTSSSSAARRGILREYVSRHGDTNVSTDTFVSVVQDVARASSGVPGELDDAFFETFFDQWIYLPSRPAYRVDWNYGASGDGFDVVVDISQTQSHHDAYAMPIEIEIALEGGTTHRATVLNRTRRESVTVHVDERPTGVVLDPDRWVLRNRPVDTSIAPVAVPALLANPARESARIRYLLTAPTAVSVRLYDAAGRRVRTLVSGVQPASSYTLEWDGTDDAGKPLAAGVYFVEMETPAARRTTRLVFLR